MCLTAEVSLPTLLMTVTDPEQLLSHLPSGTKIAFNKNETTSTNNAKLSHGKVKTR